MSVILKGGASSDLVGVNTLKQLSVTTVTSISSQPGFVDVAGEVTDGTAPLSGMSAVARTSRRVGVTLSGRAMNSVDTTMFFDNFNHATLNANVYQGNDTTMTKAVSGGFLNLNSGNSITAAQGTQVRTYRTFGIYGDNTTYIEHWVQSSIAPQSNSVCEWGAFFSSGVTTPTDGVYFRITNTATLEVVYNVNGVETTTAVAGATIAAATTYHTTIAVNADAIEFYFNEKLVATQIPRGTAGVGMSFSQYLPLAVRQYNSSGVASAVQFRVAQWMVTFGSVASNKPWNECLSGGGLNAIYSPPGVATATGTANYANSAAPAAATLSNTAAGYTTLGGQWQAAMVAGAETDYLLFGYTNPAGTATIPGRNLYINGIRIGETFNTVAANAATPIILQWGLAIGGTADTLVTADSLTAGTRAYKRITLGGQQFATGAVIGTMSPGFQVPIVPPMIVEPGCRTGVLLKVVSGTATGNSIRGTVSLTGNFE